MADLSVKEYLDEVRIYRHLLLILLQATVN